MTGDVLLRVLLFLLFNVGVATQTPVRPTVAEPAVNPTTVEASPVCAKYANDASDLINGLAFADALASLKEAVTECPDDALLAHLYGVAAYKHYEERYNAQAGGADAADVYLALGELSRSIMIDPTYSDSFFYRGLVFSALGESQHALVDYDKAIELQPDSPFAYYGRAVVYEGLKDTTHAMEDYQRFLDNYQNNDSWRDSAAQHLRGLQKPSK
jgi:tetratricopeptide (TPR) repeat protein